MNTKYKYVVGCNSFLLKTQQDLIELAHSIQNFHFVFMQCRYIVVFFSGDIYSSNKKTFRTVLKVR